MVYGVKWTQINQVCFLSKKCFFQSNVPTSIPIFNTSIVSKFRKKRTLLVTFQCLNDVFQQIVIMD